MVGPFEILQAPILLSLGPVSSCTSSNSGFAVQIVRFRTALTTTNFLTANKRTFMDGNATLHASKRLATTVAAVALTFGLFTTQTQAAGVWTNEPAGASVVLDCPFSGPSSSCGILDVYSSSITTQDASAPVSASGVLQSRMAALEIYGGMQIGITFPQTSREMFVGLMWRTNSAFSGRSANDKMFFVRGPVTNGYFGMKSCSGCPQRQFGWSHNASNLDNTHTCGDSGLWCYPNVGTPAITIGQWTKIEVYMKSSTTLTSRDGVLRWWINGVLAGNYTNINHAPSGLNDWTWTETWDGCGGNAGCDLGRLNSTEWSHFIDHLHISIPGGGNSTDQPPGPPAAPQMRGVTVP